jgi:hypothetical protein
MTEEESLTSTDWWRMLLSLPDRVGNRKPRLLDVGVIRLDSPNENDIEFLQCVDLAERLSDGEAVEQEAVSLVGEAACAVESDMAWATESERIPGLFQGIFGPKGSIYAAWEEEVSHQSLLLRDTFGNPFNPVTLNASWCFSQGRPR